MGITEYTWTQISGPNQAVFSNFNASQTNATNLTKGTVNSVWCYKKRWTFLKFYKSVKAIISAPNNFLYLS